MRASARSLALALVAVAAATAGAQVRPTVTAPPKGTLVLAGGGGMTVDVFRRFLALAGGSNAPIVVIPTALGAPRYTQDEVDVVWFRQAGATHVTLLDTLNPDIADSDRFVAALNAASGVWFGGGRQWILANVYLHTKTADAIRAVLERGGVVGGVSAGATFLGSFLVRGDEHDDTVMMASAHEEGLGLLQNVAVDQHVLARHRERDLEVVLAAHPELIGIGIDEGTAAIVRDQQLEVTGKSVVLVHDGSPQPGGAPYLTLHAGDRYDLAHLSKVGRAPASTARQ